MRLTAIFSKAPRKEFEAIESAYRQLVVDKWDFLPENKIEYDTISSFRYTLHEKYLSQRVAFVSAEDASKERGVDEILQNHILNQIEKGNRISPMKVVSDTGWWLQLDCLDKLPAKKLKEL